MNDASIRQHIHPSATSRWWQSWSSDGFRASWRKACDKAAIAGLTFHGLRESAVVRLALADATVPQIATLTGHGLRDVGASSMCTILAATRDLPRSRS